LVVSVSPPGTDIGLELLKKGGNAVDSAVATAFALAVTYPAAGNIGGGGFMVVHPGVKAEPPHPALSPAGERGRGEGAEPVVIEYREAAPAAATKTMFAPNDSWYGYKVIGVPGTVRGLALAHQRFGKLPWKDLVLPSIKLARDGFIIDAPLASSLNSILASSKDYPELHRVLGKKDGSDWKMGDHLVQA
jgi:gamma-glutamyltranspeptidase/glutathione hydrolase